MAENTFDMTDPAPYLSIVIPTYNRPEELDRCLQSLSRLVYPKDRYEVIVVDDESTESLDGVISKVRNQLQVTCIKQKRTGVGSGRNAGSALAKGEYLVFTDDDCQPAPNWLQGYARCFGEAPDCMIGGKTVNALTSNIFSTTSQLLISYLYDYYNNEPDRARFLCGSNVAVAKHLFESLGGFDPAFILVGAEDREFCDRWMDNGCKMIYEPEVLVYHYHFLTLQAFLRQHFKYGSGAYFYHAARKKRGHLKMEVEPKSFYLDLLRYPFAHGYRLKAPLIALLLILAQAANAIGYLSVRYSRSKSAIRGR